MKSLFACSQVLPFDVRPANDDLRARLPGATGLYIGSTKWLKTWQSTPPSTSLGMSTWPWLDLVWSVLFAPASMT